MDPGLETAIHAVLLTLLVSVALIVARARSILATVMLSGIYSFLMASVFLVLDAVDVAFTEAAVGAGVATVLGLVALSLTAGGDMREVIHRNVLGLSALSLSVDREAPRWPALAAATAAGTAAMFAVFHLPAVGDADAPAHTHVAPRYLAESGEAIGIPNVVTSVLADYRGFDTLGEVAVIFTAGIGVFLLLGRRRDNAEDGE